MPTAAIDVTPLPQPSSAHADLSCLNAFLSLYQEEKVITEKGEKKKIILLHFEEGDPEDPLNWSLARKWFTVSPPTSLARPPRRPKRC